MNVVCKVPDNAGDGEKRKDSHGAPHEIRTVWFRSLANQMGNHEATDDDEYEHREKAPPAREQDRDLWRRDRRFARDDRRRRPKRASHADLRSRQTSSWPTPKPVVIAGGLSVG